VLQAVVQERGMSAAFVLAGIGSLSVAKLRLADAASGSEWPGPWEILTLSGSLSPDGAHLHMSIADAQGRVLGGHVMPGCIVRTTAEVLIAELPGWRFRRVADVGTGYAELHIEATPLP
jgi:hypothetical protein